MSRLRGVLNYQKPGLEANEAHSVTRIRPASGHCGETGYAPSSGTQHVYPAPDGDARA